MYENYFKQCLLGIPLLVLRKEIVDLKRDTLEARFSSKDGWYSTDANMFFRLDEVEGETYITFSHRLQLQERGNFTPLPYEDYMAPEELIVIQGEE